MSPSMRTALEVPQRKWQQQQQARRARRLMTTVLERNAVLGASKLDFARMFMNLRGGGS